MDREGVIVKMLSFRVLLRTSHELWSRHPHDYSELPSWKETDEQIRLGLPAIKRLAERIDPSLGNTLLEGSSAYLWPWSQVDNATLGLIGTLKSEEEVDSLLGPAGPQISAGRLHPWVWGPAASLWDDGHRRAAIQAASTQLDLALQAKLNRFDVGATDLVTQAFTIDAPEMGKPRLRFRGLSPGTDIYKSAHKGAMYFGRGCFMAIRNLATHDLTEPEEQVALELLAALSVMAGWIDAAEVESE